VTIEVTALDEVTRLWSELSAIRRDMLTLSKNKQLEPEIRIALTRAATSLAQADAEIGEVL
jgi:hypothetical protein